MVARVYKIQTKVVAHSYFTLEFVFQIDGICASLKNVFQNFVVFNTRLFFNLQPCPTCDI